jgi:glycerol dehydrogenase
MLHGELVAFGTLVQMSVEERPDSEILEVAQLLNDVNLPVTLDGLGQTSPFTSEELDIVVQATLGAVYAKNMAPALTAERLIRGLARADELGQRFERIN